ncbi:hypothetical protein PMAYCL1PPCAC_15810, partial [Pristionchus mayeri]
FRTSPTLKPYSRILFCSALVDLIGACMQLALIPRDIIFNDADVIEYYGLCTLGSVWGCWLCTGIIEMMIALNDALICVSFHFRLKVIEGNQPSLKRTLLIIMLVIFLHAPLGFGYFDVHRRGHHIADHTNDTELIEELQDLTYFGQHCAEIQALNVQLILICFLTGALLYASMAIGLTQSSILAQCAIFPVSALQFTLAPIANIMCIKPYR